ncbi:MAG TPA: amidohydrolase family protein [Rhizomicrobium sp.]|jgi:predicted TIM-barrel fold metal-dependent hydrolase|nr:amidohydrolase family protein [Rhizomicrobium sp.]
MQRRAFLAGAAALASAPGFAADAIPVIDTHVHLFDPTRPQGVPYSGPKGQPPQLALPENYHKQIVDTGIVGAVVVEASPWVEDNLWILERANSDPVFVGVVGDLDPSKPEFPEYLGRFSKDPLWRGIRYARVWQMEGGKQVLKPGMADGLKLLTQMGQTLDMANPSFDLLRGALLAMEAVPDLRVVMDHMPSLDPIPQTQALYDSLIADLAQHPNFFLKLSQVIHKDDKGVIVTAPRARLDQLMAAFGEDRVMFGGDWPNSVGTATIAEALALMRDYFAGRPRIQAEKYFWRNSQHIYRWKKRDAAQPG